MNVELLLFFIIILIFGGIILFFVAMRAQGSRSFNQDKYRMEWLKIDRQLVKGNESSYQLCVLQADKLLDKALKEAGYKGTTMGERMKSAQSVWSNANHVWTAHKIRNQVAHESDVSLKYETVQRAMIAYKQALKDVGAI